MDRLRWLRAQELFDALVDLPPDERTAALREACEGDWPLQEQVEGLFLADDADSELVTQAGAARRVVEDETVQAATAAMLSSAGFDELVPLGRGGMGEVWRARNGRGEEVALKLVHPHLLGTPEIVARFAREAQVGLRVHDTHVVRTRGIHLVQREGRQIPLLELDFLHGRTLAEHLTDRGPLDVDEVLRLALHAARGLRALHAAGAIHRDLKPSNLHLGDDGVLRLLDLGVAGTLAHDTALTHTGQLVGTLVYAAPEQVLGGREVDGRTDLYALGLVLRRALLGRLDHEDLPLGQLLSSKAQLLSPLRSERPSVPQWLGLLLDALCAPAPEARPSSAVQLLAYLEEQRAPARPDHPTDLVGQPVVRTLVLTDLVDSTALTAALGDGPAAQLFARHDRSARDLLATYHGQEIDKSDGFLLLFEHAEHAIAYGLAYHESLRELSRSTGQALQARVGLHTGSVRLRNADAADIARGAKPVEVEGAAKPLAARVMALAQGGQALITASTLAAVDLAEGWTVARYGHYQLKGLPEPVMVAEVAAGPHLLHAPPEDGPKAYRVVRRDEAWLPAAEVPHNLPKAADTFFGRQAELHSLMRTFSEGAHLVTLVGPAGVGKTRLALHYGRRWLGDWPGGVWRCRLGEARTSPDLVRALGRDLDVQLEGADPLALLGDALAHRGTALVVLDTVEHLVEAVSSCLDTLRPLAPSVHWLLTSRKPLVHPEEQLLPIDPLTTHTDLEDVGSDDPAVGLFVARARRVQPRFVLTESHRADIIQLVRLLDGLPLAIELAAARIRVLTPARILDRMGKRFDLLTSRGAKVVTLRGALDGSWELLTPYEQAALAQLSIFEGWFDVDAVEEILDLTAWPEAPWTLDVLTSLVDQSLVRSHAEGEGRFSLMASVRAYAAEALGQDAEQRVRQAHTHHYARWGEPEALGALSGQDGALHYRSLQADLDNIVAATRHAAALGLHEQAALAAVAAVTLLSRTGPLTLAESLGALALKDRVSEALGIRLRIVLGIARNRAGAAGLAEPILAEARRAAQRGELVGLQAQASLALGHGALLRRRPGAAQQLLQEALEGARAARHVAVEAEAMAELAHLNGIRGGLYEGALAQLQTACSLFQQAGDLAGEAVTESYLGALHATHGHLDAGLRAYVRARDLAESLGDRRTMGLACGMIAGIHMLAGRPEASRTAFQRALRIQQALGDRVHECMHAANYAHLLEEQRELDEAARWLRRAIRIASDIGDPMMEGTSLGRLGVLHARAGRMAQAATCLEEGERLLTDIGDPVQLAKLICQRAEVALLAEDLPTAQEALARARHLAAPLALAPAAELSVTLARLTVRAAQRSPPATKP